MNVKGDFPIFKNHSSLVFLDSASTSLKPQVVIDKLVEYYSSYSANIKRGIYGISERATEEYEKSRQTVADFIGAKKEEIIFTRNTTEALNLVAYSLGRQVVERGDEVVTSVMEHHSNFVPWQQLAFEVGADFKVIDIDDEGILAGMDKLDEIITQKTKILALTHVSNVLGTINPIGKIASAARKINPQIVIVVDGAQAVAHLPVDMSQLGVDFFAFSGHKVLGPTGVGVLWGGRNLLEKMYPFQYGGEMIEEVALDHTTFLPPPDKYEAGTPAIAEVIAVRVAIEYIKNVGEENIRRHDQMLVEYSISRLKEEFKDAVTIYGPTDLSARGSTVAFNLKSLHPHDLAQILDEDGVAIRAGHHCTMPLHTRLGIVASARASFHLYNTKEDIDKLIKGLHKAVKLLQ